MNPAQRAEDRLLQAAKQLATPEEKAAFLQDACGEDAQLRQRLQARLQAEEHTAETEDADAVVSSYSMASPREIPAATIKPGDRICHYVVVRRQGAGGMGEVYLAQDTRLGRLVALKFLPEEAARDAARRLRFYSEARAAAALDHPNICTIYDVAETDDVLPYIAMEWLEGQTLRERMAGAPLPLDELLGIAVQVAEALEAAHTRGIVHRDLKPANVSLMAGGLVKVLDFGLAKWQQLASPEDAGTTASRIATGQIAESGATTSSQTAAGQIVGSPGYMSPEQAAGKQVDYRTDLFSLGVMLYEMATGRSPFVARTPAEIVQRTIEQEPEPLVRFNAEAPVELERIVTRCLQKDPRRRYQSARDLRADLAALRTRLTAPKNATSGQVVTLLCLEVPEAVSLKQSGRLQDAAELLRQQQVRLQQLVNGPGVQVEAFSDLLVVQFGRASEAVQAALRIVSENGVACRLGLHLGEVLEPQSAEPLGRFGVHLETVVRLMQLAGPGHVLISRGAFDSARAVLRRVEAPGVGAPSWVSHGQYAFEGLEEPLEVCEVSLAGRTASSAPPTTNKARRLTTPEGETVLGWRPGVGQEVPNTQWVLEEKLGEGGFGEVWRAQHGTLEEARVFKFCFRGDRVRSLKREVTLFRILKERIGEHPNIVKLHDIYFDHPPFYLEEEYVEGRDLRTWCEARGGVDKVPLAVRLKIVAQAADALQAAHDAGVIHRDVKPGNILISGQWSKASNQWSKASNQSSVVSGQSSVVSGQQSNSQLSVKLTDFGIGQVTSEEVLKEITCSGFTQTLMSPSSSHTGTQLYMAPELLAGKPASTRSDIYSLGVVLYQLLIGDCRKPLTADWARGIQDALLREDLERCFASDPVERYAGAGQLAAQLRGYEQRKAEQARQKAEAAERERLRRQVEHRHRIARASTAVAGVLILLAVALGYGLQRARTETFKARHIAYASDMNVAWRALTENNLEGVARLLNAHRPRRGEQDLRNWEWRYLWQACRGEQLWTLSSLGEVASLCLLPDGRLVSASQGSPGLGVELWDPQRREIVRRKTTTVGFSGLAVFPDGRRIAAAMWSPVVRFLDTESLEELSNFKHRSTVQKIVLSPDGQLLSGTGPEDISVWEVATGKRLWTTKGPLGAVADAPFLKDGRSVVCQLADGHLAVLDSSDGRLLRVLGLYGRIGSNIAVSPDGRKLAAGKWSGQVCLIDLPTSRTQELTNHIGAVRAVAFSPDGLELASGGEDNMVRLWEVESGNERLLLRGHQRGVSSLVYSTDGRRLFTGGFDGTIRAWDPHPEPAPGTSVLPAGFFTVPVGPDGSGDRSLPIQGRRSLSRDGRLLVACSTNGFRRVLSLETFAPIGDVQEPGRFACVSVSPDGRRFAAGMTNGAVTVWDLVAGRTSWTFQAHSNAVDVVEYSPDSRRLATASRGAEIRVWNHGEPRAVFSWTLGPGTAHVQGLAFTHDGSTLAVPKLGWLIHLLSLRAGGRDRQINTGEAAFCVDISRDGSLMAAGLNSGVKVWDLPSLRLVTRLRGSRGSFVNSVGFSPDGRRVVAPDNQGMAWLWDLATGREIGRFDRHAWARFQPNGNTLVLASNSHVDLLRAPSWAEIEAAEKSTDGKTK